MQSELSKNSLSVGISTFFGGYVNGETNDHRTYYAGNSRLWREDVLETFTSERSLSFDISNNRIIASADIRGVIRTLGVIDGVESAYEKDLRGVYLHKLMTIIDHPSEFLLKLDGMEVWEQLPTVSTELFGNFLPRASFALDGLDGTILSFAPIGNNGRSRPSSIIMLLEIYNNGSQLLAGEIKLPDAYERISDEPEGSIIDFARQECIALLEGQLSEKQRGTIAFALAPGQRTAIAISLIVGKSHAEMVETNALLQQKAVTAWRDETLAYLGQQLGQFTISSPGQYYAEALTRQVELCRQSVLLNADGQCVGSFLGSNVNTRPEVWMKDTYYEMLPLCWFNPEVARQGVLLFAQWGLPPRSWGRGLVRFPASSSIVHSLGNAISAIALAGIYYQATGDQEFFCGHPEVYTYGKRVLQEIQASSLNHESLFPSMYISDGDARGDYHTGSNIMVWYAFKTMTRIGNEIYGDDAAVEWSKVAQSIRQAIYTHCVGQGPLGSQFYEGAYQHGGFVPGHDGEESDLTLAPFYGFCEADEPALIHHAQLAFSELNPYYVSALDSISWWDEQWFGPTFPAYIHALAGIRSESEIEAALERIRWRTDLDGSIWWWPNTHECRDYAQVRRSPSKCGWAAGVYIAKFIHDIIGIHLDLPARTLQFRPFCPWSEFHWQGLKLGNVQLDVEYHRSATTLSAAITHRSPATFTTSLIELVLPPQIVPTRILVNGQDGQELIYMKQRYERMSIGVSQPLPINETLRLQVEWNK